MSDIDNEQTESVNLPESDAIEQGLLHIEEADETQKEGAPVTSLPSQVKPATPLSSQALERAGTAEHLAARRPILALDTNTPEMKQRLGELRTEVTRLLTSLRWEDQSVENTADQFIPLLNVGSVPQWKAVLIPFLYEIDRSGVLIPVWLNIIERSDPSDLPHDANLAETTLGRAKRFAILMLGNYRVMGISGIGKAAQSSGLSRGEVELTQFLGQLSSDPNTSLYATQALVKHATVPAIQALVSALKDAKGWAKVDVVEGCLALKQERFNDLLIASGLDKVPGLESYVAIPIYRSIPLENYLHSGNDKNQNPRLLLNAALIFNQVLQDSSNPVTALADPNALPMVFEGRLPVVAKALFDSARSHPNWQNTIAVHRLGVFMGVYWSEISRGNIKNAAIIEPVYHCLPMMNDVERWMAGPGRDVLLETLSDGQEEIPTPVIKVLGEMREPRAIALLITLLEKAKTINDRTHALALGTICDTLGNMGDRRAEAPMLQLVYRTVDINRRAQSPRRRDNLSPGDNDIPGSIVYAAAVRACGQLADHYALDGVLRAINDLDPYVRTQAIEAIKRIDPTGEDARSRAAVREALNDPRDGVVRTACQLIAQYRDIDATNGLQHLVETRPELSAYAYDALRQLGH